MALAPYFLIALSFIGLADTAYLSYFEFMNLIPSCAIGGCEVVLTSVYSKFHGVPLAYIGLLYYIGMFALAIYLARKPQDWLVKLAVLGYTAIGLGFSAYFEFYIQGTLIGTYCMYCGISALTTLGLFVTAFFHWKSRSIDTVDSEVGGTA